MSGDLQRYDDWQARYERAYAAFKSTYEIRYPPPERQTVKRENTGAVLALAALVVASVIVSGSRTIGEFGGGLIGVAGFVMIEIGIVAYAFIRTRVDYDDTRHQSVKRLVSVGMWLAFIVAVFANVHSTLKAGGILPDWLDTVVLLVLGFSAPVLAFISGDVLGMLAVMDASRSRRADREYLDALRIWSDGLNASWNAQKQRMGVSLPSATSAVDGQNASQNIALSARTPLRTDANERGHGFGAGYERRHDARDKVRVYLLENPEAFNLTVRELAEAVGVGKTVAAAVRKELLANEGLGETQPAEAISSAAQDDLEGNQAAPFSDTEEENA